MTSLSPEREAEIRARLASFESGREVHGEDLAADVTDLLAALDAQTARRQDLTLPTTVHLQLRDQRADTMTDAEWAQAMKVARTEPVDVDELEAWCQDSLEEDDALNPSTRGDRG